MAEPIRIIVVEGNTAETSAKIVSLGGKPYADCYAATLKSLNPAVECTIARPSEDGVDCLPKAPRGEIDGIVWTGSSLHAYSAIAPVEHQIELARRVYDWRVPIFGSCWGFQIMTIALGGEVRRNPKGREIGVGKDMALTELGAQHPMYKGKPRRFEAIAAHVDEVHILPKGGRCLAGNAVSSIQAAAWEDDGRLFWGTQYHPEFNLGMLANTFRRNGASLIEEKLFPDASALEAFAGAMDRIDRDPVAERDTAAKLGFTPAITDAKIRYTELANWLDAPVQQRRVRTEKTAV